MNGTLDLTDFTFREHRESDLSSMQTNFNYEPTASSDDWYKFIADISNNDSKRMALLRNGRVCIV